MDIAKKVITKDADGNDNGYLIELQKAGRKTVSYLTVAYPGCVKGFHSHCVRESNYVCIKGNVHVVLAIDGELITHKLTSDPPSRLNIGLNIPTAIKKPYDEEAWLINFPDPAYDPELDFEQTDIAPENISEWLMNARRNL